MDWCLEILLWNYTGSGKVGDIGYQVYVTSWPDNRCQQIIPESPYLHIPPKDDDSGDDVESVCISQLDEECYSTEKDDDTLCSFDDILDERKNADECIKEVENSKDLTLTDSETNAYYEDRDAAVCLRLKYDSQTESLDVTVMECRGLPVLDERKHPLNPYVKSYLVIANIRYGKMKTKTMPTSTSPKFGETFRYYVTKSCLMDSELLVAVWHYNRYGRNFCIGQTTIGLNDFCFRDPSAKWFKLQQTEDIYHPCFLI